MALSTILTRPMRVDWTASGECTSGSTAHPKGATRPASGGAATTSTRPSREAKPKSNLQNQFISAACNVKRWGAQAASLSVSAASRNEFYLLTLIRYNYAHSSHPYKMPIAAIIENGKITKSGGRRRTDCVKSGDWACISLTAGEHTGGIGRPDLVNLLHRKIAHTIRRDWSA